MTNTTSPPRAEDPTRRALLIGAPALIAATALPTIATAQPASREALEAYRTWLMLEARMVSCALWPDEAERDAHEPFIQGNRALTFHAWRPVETCLTRAEPVMALVGCDWKGGEHV